MHTMSSERSDDRHQFWTKSTSFDGRHKAHPTSSRQHSPTSSSSSSLSSLPSCCRTWKPVSRKHRTCHRTRYMSLLCLWTITVACIPASSYAQIPLTATAATTVTDAKVLEQLEKNLLDMFGLSKRPSKRGPDFHVPPHMLKLYEEHVRGAADGGRVRHRRHPTYSANTIRSFMQLHDDDSIGENGAILKFNVSTMPDHEVLKAAELRVLRPRNTKSGHGRYTVQVYDTIHPGNARMEPITRLLDTQILKDNKHELENVWESLDATLAVHRWLSNPQRNHGLQVRVVPTTDAPTSEPQEHYSRIRLKRSATPTQDGDQWQDEQPVLITYTDDGRNPPTRSRNRRRNNDGTRNRRSSNRRSRKRSRKRSRCQRRPLYVHFSEVGWNDWIVAPPGYDAYYCSGECPSHLAAHMNATNHAIVQNLVHSVDNQAVPKPCCVPTELSPISMLYKDEYEKVTLKNYQNMVVEACGCR